MYRTNDPLTDFERYEALKEALNADLPHCDYCGLSIDDHYFNINGDVICESCLNDNFRVTVEI